MEGDKLNGHRAIGGSMRSPRAIFGAFALILVGAARQQATGSAEITSPAPGEPLAGVVTILGTADHPDFLGYDLAFANEADPTGTWFLIGEPGRTPVLAGSLALWDTLEVNDGEYDLRLRVWLRDGTALSAEVTGLDVRNGRVAPAAGAAATTVPASALTVAPTITLLPAATPTPPPPRPNRARSALVGGVLIALLGLASLAAYSLSRSSLRLRWAALRSRMLHRNLERRPSRRSRR
jgi:hypothetical protein